MKKCYKCGNEWLEKHTPGFREECEKCFESLHCCRNCRFFREEAREWCAEVAAKDEIPRTPEEANKCSFFLMADKDKGDMESNSSNAKEKLESLFGNSEQSEKQDTTPPDWTRLEDNDKKDLDMIFKPPDNK